MSNSFVWRRRRSMFRWLTAAGAAAVLGLGAMPVVGDTIPSIFAGFEIVNDGKRLNVLFNANNQVLADFLTRVEPAAAAAELEIPPVPVDFNPQQRAEIARKISADSEGWAERLGVSSVSSVRFDTVSGEVSIVTTDESFARGAEVLDVEGVPVSVVVDTTAGPVLQNRAVDSPPETGGTRLSY